MNSMKEKIEKGSRVRIASVVDEGAQFQQVYGVLSEELQKRMELKVEKASWEQVQKGSFAEVDLLFVTLETLPEPYYEVEPPPRIKPFEDYADHICLRFIQQGGKLTVLVITGHEKAWLFAAGAWLHRLRVYEERLELDTSPVDLRPMNPRRGCLFLNTRKTQEDFIADEGSWFEIIRNQVLWGNNLFGLIPSEPRERKYSSRKPYAEFDWMQSPHKERLDRIQTHAHELGLRNLVWQPYSGVASGGLGKQFQQPPFCDILWLTPHEGLMEEEVEAQVSWKEYVQWGVEIQETFSRMEEKPEFWLGSTGYGEEELGALFAYVEEHTHLCDALVSGPQQGMEAMMQKEMPLTLQLITMSLLSDRDRPLMAIGRTIQRFVDTSPLTYGSLALSAYPWEEVHRYLWSRMSWEPEPGLDLLLEGYGHWFFGAESAVNIKKGIMTLMQGEVSFEEQRSQAWNSFMEAGKKIPSMMRPWAEPRLELLLKDIS